MSSVINHVLLLLEYQDACTQTTNMCFSFCKQNAMHHKLKEHCLITCRQLDIVQASVVHFSATCCYIWVIGIPHKHKLYLQSGKECLSAMLWHLLGSFAPQGYLEHAITQALFAGLAAHGAVDT